MHSCKTKGKHALPNYIDQTGCIVTPINTNTNRYELFIPFINQSGMNKYVIVIMKNPSHSFMGSTSSSQNLVLDCSTFHVLEYINQNYRKQYDGVIFLNLFPCYGTNPCLVNQTYGFLPNIYNPNLFQHPDIQANNNQIYNTLKTFSEADVITAWGTYGFECQIESLYYDAQINEVLNLIQITGHIARIVDKQLPRILPAIHPHHGLMWNIENDFIL